ncbi:glycosyltransferase family 4 protein [Tateyamaria sp. ANG-S1]|uniref:glycosyltransferase family 4 protein n=1 Tax=Tateyamaria sp. ANG-S1 TaxID=1577905 RepID=UPI00057CCDE2|nr:glycosyltransferase family 4 protein [Tateyamaria sp. ANG-S1]KIC44934.1 glycosyl transferase family 1 [Tateyamaria sp. ANG-S1]
MTKAVFAIPGDKDRRTGGFIYEARVLQALNDIGCPTAHLQLPDSFPDPTATDMRQTLDMLRAVPADQPIILDGLVFGAIDPDGLAAVQAPVIAMIHHPLGLETGLSHDRAAFLLQNETAAIRRADHIIAPSPETSRVLTERFGAKPGSITCAPPGFDRPPVARQIAETPLVLSVGLIAPRKGHDILLSALALIQELPWRAEIVGGVHDPAYAEALRRQSTELGLDRRVTFAGEIDDDTLISRMNSASIFALATRYEGYGMVLSEAMLFGLPIVTCDAGAVATTVGDGAIVVPKEDPAAFADALAQLLSNPSAAEALGQSALEQSKILPRWEDTAKVFAHVIVGLKPAK